MKTNALQLGTSLKLARLHYNEYRSFDHLPKYSEQRHRAFMAFGFICQKLGLDAIEVAGDWSAQERN